MDCIDDSILDQPNGGILSIIVHCNSKKKVLFTSVDVWRKAIHCYVVAPARNGKANMELVRRFSQIFNVPESSVHIVSGLSSSIKKSQNRGYIKDETYQYH